MAIDGSKFKAVNRRDKSFTRKSVKLRLKKTKANIDRYLAKLDAVDKDEPEIHEITAKELKQKIASVAGQAKEALTATRRKRQPPQEKKTRRQPPFPDRH